MQRLLSYLARYRRRVAVGCLCLVATATLAMSIPWLLKHAVDAISQDGASPRSVAPWALAVIVLALVQAVARTFSRFLIFNVGRDVEYDLRNDLFRHLERLPVEFYQTHPTGDLMSRLVNDISAVRMMLGPGILNLLNTPIYYAYAVSFMVQIDGWLTLAALAPYPVMLLVVKSFSRRMMEGTLRVQEGLAEMSSLVQENVSGIHVVKAYAREEDETRRFRRLNDRFQSVSLELGRVRGLLAPVFRAVSSLGILVVLWMGGARVIAGHLTLGDVVAFIGYLHLLAWPTMALGWMLSVLQRGKVALRRLDEIFDTQPTIRDPVRPTEPHASAVAAAAASAAGAATVEAPPAVGSPGASARPIASALARQPISLARGPRVERGEIAFEGVSFRYPSAPDRLVLDSIDARIPAGATVAIVGRAGAGKTSMLHLVPRLFDPTAGRVLVDGRDVREYRLADLRRGVAMVPQDPFLFSTSIRDNLAFGTELAHSSSQADIDTIVRDAASWAAVDADVEDFPRGYETMVGERGITLSGGQKQRVTLARGLLVDAPVLILDDALSSVDTRTEARILASLEERRRGRTCLIVAHRLTTVQDADLILVLDGGRIVERGDHHALLARGGLYAELFSRQRLADELEAI